MQYVKHEVELNLCDTTEGKSNVFLRVIGV